VKQPDLVVNPNFRPSQRIREEGKIEQHRRSGESASLGIAHRR